MLLADAVSHSDYAVLCLLGLLAWVGLAICAAIKALVPARFAPGVSWVGFLIAAVIVFVLWVVLC